MSVIYQNGTYKSYPNISLLKRQLEAKINKITSVDTSQFVTKEELNTKQDTIVDLDQIRLGSEKGKTALQSIPSEYITQTELENKGYLTAIPSEYVTETDLESKGYLTGVPSEYVTETELENKGYLTTIPSEYVTNDELENKGYLTGIPSEYVTETELNEKGYLTEQQINNLKLIQSLTERITALEEAVLELQTPSGELDT